MGTKVKKGFLKPMKLFSQMFDNKEPEMQIGFPTEVKHVAHIGCDGPTSATSNPGWMNNYHSAPLNPTFGDTEGRETANTWGSQGSDFLRGGLEDSPAQRTPAAGGGTEESGSAPTRPRHSRRHKSDETSITSGDPIGGDAVEAVKKSRRPRKKESAAGSQDTPAIPKQRRKSKDGGGSVRAPKSKATAEEDGANPSAHGKNTAAEEKERT